MAPTAASGCARSGQAAQLSSTPTRGLRCRLAIPLLRRRFHGAVGIVSSVGAHARSISFVMPLPGVGSGHATGNPQARLDRSQPQGDGPHVSATLSVMPMSGLSRQAAVSRLGTVRPRSGAGGGVRFLTDHMKEILCQRKKEKDLHGNPRGRGGLNLNLPNPSAS